MHRISEPQLKSKKHLLKKHCHINLLFCHLNIYYYYLIINVLINLRCFGCGSFSSRISEPQATVTTSKWESSAP
jgi:hypothetical protein